MSDLNEPAGVDPARPGIARVYDYLLGGGDNYAVDRIFAAELENANPHLRQLVRDNRYFLARTVRHLAREVGILQFLDIGTGLPTQDNVHEVAQRIAPDARVVYVDNDAMVLAHARALLAGAPQGATDYIDADAGDTSAILTRAAATLDLTRPVAALLVATLHFIRNAEAVVAPLRDALPPGSHLVITHAVDRPDFKRIGDLYQRETNRGYLRTPGQIAELFGDWEMVEPGLVDLPDWRPDLLEKRSPAAGLFLGGVARKAKPW